MHFLILLLLSQPILTIAYTNITAVFAFGDSTLDPGNNNGLVTIVQANHAPYGCIFPGGVATGRFSEGKLITDFIVSMLGLKPLLPPYLDPTVTDQDLLTGASFASAGSGLDDLTARAANVLSLSNQVRFFQEAVRRMESAVGFEESGRVVNNGLYIVSAGTNDMVYNYYRVPSWVNINGLSGYHDTLLMNLENNIKRLHSLGARMIGVAGLPAIGCLPLQMRASRRIFHRSCISQQNIDSQTYNTKLVSLTSRLQQTLPGSRIAYIDFYSTLMDMITNPLSHGFIYTNKGCCGTGSPEMGPLCNVNAPTCPDPSSYMFWDSIHPSQSAYYDLAQYIMGDVLPFLVS